MSDVLTKPKVKITEELATEIKKQEELERQVIVHCKIDAPSNIPMGIRIWPTTFLLDNGSTHKSTLLHNENIPIMPAWKMIPVGKPYTFTLIFSGLPKSCTTFHLAELIPQQGGFQAMNIARNKQDVYDVLL